MILIVDFGSQTTHLISRRIKAQGAETKIINPDQALETIKTLKPKGIILSGGPFSVYDKGAPTVDKKIFSLGIPMLCICYGLQITAKLLGGKVISGRKEYGPASLSIVNRKSLIVNRLPESFQVWMSHGDEVVNMPKDFTILGSSEHVKYAFVEAKDRKIWGVLFHPEVEHTDHGDKLLSNFLQATNTPLSPTKINIYSLVKQIKDEIKNDYVIGAVSGGVDSTVAGALTIKAIGKQFIPIYVDNGLMRVGTTDLIKKIFKNLGVEPLIVNVEDEMLKRLKGVVDPEIKRKIIGNYYIELFETKMQEIQAQKMSKAQKGPKNVKYLLQGTIYSDVIESQGTKHASKIKSHHNVGGLPEKMKLKLLEPLRNFYKDEVREIGRLLGLPKEFVEKQPFPGPGYGVRIRGEVTKERLEEIKKADQIILEELGSAGLLKKVFMSFPIMSGAESVAVKGDGRFFGEVIAVRVIESKDVMTANVAEVPYPVLQKIASRIVNEVPHISRVVYDITTKPPATMEWE